MVFRSNKHRSFSERDILVLYQLYEKVTLNVRQIHQLCFIDVKIFSVYKVLIRLKRGGVIRSQTYELGKAGRIADIYLLTNIGFKVLKFNLPELAECSDVYREKQAPQLLTAIQHRLLIIDYWISLELALKAYTKHSLKLFVPEYKKLPNGKPITLRVVQCNGEPVQVRNDALFILTNNELKKQYLFGLEADRSTMPIQAGDPVKSIMHEKLAARSSIEDKLLKLNSVFECGNQAFINLGGELAGFQGMRLIFLTVNASHARNFVKVVSKASTGLQVTPFLISFWGELSLSNAFNCQYFTFDLNENNHTVTIEDLLT